ncbi:hypothetical protein [Ekhidna sp.]|uniref:hypothetical protein n=1 Tax=Ekhidna sp. TaxID=2608089 RepID=UPI003B5B279E
MNRLLIIRLLLVVLIIESCSGDEGLESIDADLIGTWRSYQIRLIDFRGEVNDRFNPDDFPINNDADSVIYRFNTDGVVEFSCCPATKYSVSGDSLFFHMTDSFTQSFGYSVELNRPSTDSLFVKEKRDFSGALVTREFVFYKVN